MAVLANRVWTLDNYLTCISLPPSATKRQPGIPVQQVEGGDQSRRRDYKALTGGPQALRRQATADIGAIMKASNTSETTNWLPGTATGIPTLLPGASVHAQSASRLILHGGQHSNVNSTEGRHHGTAQGSRNLRLRRCNTVGASGVGCRFLSPYITETRPPFSTTATTITNTSDNQPMTTAMQLFRQMIRQRSVERQSTGHRKDLLTQSTTEYKPSIGKSSEDGTGKPCTAANELAMPSSSGWQDNVIPTERRLRFLTANAKSGTGELSYICQDTSLLARAQLLGIVPNRESGKDGTGGGSGAYRQSINDPVCRHQLSSADRRAVFQRRDCTVEAGDTVSIGYSHQNDTPSGHSQNRDQSDRRIQIADISKTNLRPRPDQAPVGLCINSDQFQGSALVQWLCRQLVFLGDSWTYSLIDTVGHICYSLLALGVIQLVPRATVGESRHLAGQGRYRSYTQGQALEDPVACGTHDTQMSSSLDNAGSTMERFELDQFYRWTGGTTTRTHFDDGNSNRIASGQQTDQSVGLSAYHDELTELRREYDYELAKLVRSHEVQLFKVKNQGVMKACQLTDRIEALEKEVEKYRILAGIEHLTKQTENRRNISASLADMPDSQFSPPQSPENLTRVRRRFQFPDSRSSHLGMTRVGFSLSGERLDRSIPPKPPPRARAASDTNDVRSTFLKLSDRSARLTIQALNTKDETVQLKDMQARPRDTTSSAVLPYGHEENSDSASNSIKKSDLPFSQAMDCKNIEKSSSTVRRSRRTALLSSGTRR